MTPQHILEIAKATPDIGSVKHEEFVGYIMPISQRKKVNDSWVNVENPYMTVDGRMMMASLDHIRQGKKLDYGDPVVLFNDDSQITLLVTVTSEVYGRRHGIATSDKTKTTSEGVNSWEVAETSAIGRALSQFGYGVFAGSGLPSANDMQRVETRQNKPAPPAAPKPADKPKEPVVEKAKETNGNGASAKPTPTERGGICSVHNETTNEYKKADGTLFWGHRHNGETCFGEPKPETVLVIPGGVK